jgi:hypothetical protein
MITKRETSLTNFPLEIIRKKVNTVWHTVLLWYYTKSQIALSHGENA